VREPRSVALLHSAVAGSILWKHFLARCPQPYAYYLSVRSYIKDHPGGPKVDRRPYENHRVKFSQGCAFDHLEAV
jgi:hypothetical protein